MKVVASICVASTVNSVAQQCDKVITEEYTGMTKRGEGRSQIFAEIVGNEVTVCSSDKTGFSVTFNKKPTQVRQCI